VIAEIERENLHITQCNHANGLPYTQADARSDATVEPSHAVLGIHILQCLAHSQVLWPVGVLSLALHLNTNDLNRLIPCRQTTTDTTGDDFLHSSQLLAMLFACRLSDALLCESGETEARTPVCDLANGDCVDTLIDASNTLFPVDVSKGLECGGRLDTLSGHLVLCDLNGLHARAETHCSICLRQTTKHASRDTGNEVVGTKGFGIVLGFGSDEEEDGALG
jgi:hypothetical protein